MLGTGQLVLCLTALMLMVVSAADVPPAPTTQPCLANSMSGLNNCTVSSQKAAANSTQRSARMPAADSKQQPVLPIRRHQSASAPALLQLVGAQVTGSFFVRDGATNFFDSRNIPNRVPPGFGNSATNPPENVPISDDVRDIEFGFADLAIKATADVTTSGLVTLTNEFLANEELLIGPFTFTFTSTAFNQFKNGNLSGDVVNNTFETFGPGVAVTAVKQGALLTIQVPSWSAAAPVTLTFSVQLQQQECTPGPANLCCSEDGLFLDQGTICRASTMVCDVAETCPGGSGICPPDVFAGPSVICRPAAGPCDVPESCTGASAACPYDNNQSAGTLCRAARNPCEVDTTCNGVDSTCSVQVVVNGKQCPFRPTERILWPASVTVAHYRNRRDGPQSYGGPPTCLGRCLVGRCELDETYPGCCSVEQNSHGYESHNGYAQEAKSRGLHRDVYCWDGTSSK